MPPFFKKRHLQTYLPRIMEFKAGDKVKHYKRELEPDPDTDKYTYEIIGIGQNTENDEQYFIYKPLYESDHLKSDFYIRPISEFYEKVDKEKYPCVTQEYKFERLD